VSRLLSVCLTVVVLAPLAARPEEAKPPPPPKWYDTFEIHGLVDTYYSANFDQQQSAPNQLRVFDALNGFQLSYAKLTAQLAPTAAYSAGFRADIGFGQTAAILNSSASYGLGAGAAPSAGIGSPALQQAYLSLKLPAEIVVDAGKFVTNTGAEVIEAKDNWLYSRSLLFGFAIPFTHTGVRATIPIPGADGFSIMAGVFNGFDNPPGPVGPEKMGHLALMYSGPSNLSVTVNGLYGYALPADADGTFLLDAVVARSFGDLSLDVNFDYRKKGGLKLWGVAGMARYSFIGDKLRLSARGEYVDDSDGLQVATPGNKYYEGTLGLSVPVGGNAELRVEGRHDQLSSGSLVGSSSGQTTIQVAALAWF
jgi:Putative beta-barrel porin-2, OmpL-like. bbp2